MTDTQHHHVKTALDMLDGVRERLASVAATMPGKAPLASELRELDDARNALVDAINENGG